MIKTCFLDHSVGGIVTNYIITNYYLQTTTYKLLYCTEKAPKSKIFKEFFLMISKKKVILNQLLSSINKMRKSRF